MPQQAVSQAVSITPSHLCQEQSVCQAACLIAACVVLLKQREGAADERQQHVDAQNGQNHTHLHT